uniref:Ovule protein n=1 Tax=Steinernema glaseri TaxID=37863 RepID=A0A1I8AHH0_9BILA
MHVYTLYTQSHLLQSHLLGQTQVEADHTSSHVKTRTVDRVEKSSPNLSRIPVSFDDSEGKKMKTSINENQRKIL